MAILFVFVGLFPFHLLLVLVGRKAVIPPVFLSIVGHIAGLRIKVSGRPRQGALLLANHLSWLDILALSSTAQSVFVAHSGLADHRVLKWLCDQNETVFITRDQRRSVAGQVTQVRDAIGRRRLTIFPEATTNDGINMLPFRSSLLAAVEPFAGKVPIQPVALDYTDAPEIAWFGLQLGYENARHILSRAGRVDLTVHFLAPLAGDALADRKTMAAAAQGAVEAALHTH